MDLRDIMLEATAEVQQILRELLQELTAEVDKDQVRMMWAQLPDEAKEQFMRENPDEYRMLMDEMERR